MLPIVFTAPADIPGSPVRAGDSIVFDPVSNRLCTLCQALDVGFVLNQYEAGALIPLSPAPLPAELHRAAQRLLPPSPAVPPEARPLERTPIRLRRRLEDPV